MTESIDESKALIFDADVIIHFLSGDCLLDLFKIFPNRCIILDKVYNELAKREATKITLDNMISLNYVELIDFPTDYKMIQEYAILKNLRNRGDGESACMSFCLINGDVIASSNLRDIKNYCQLHKIEYLTTMDFVKHAYLNDLWTKDKCDEFITAVLSKNQRLPYENFTDFANSIGLQLTA